MNLDLKKLDIKVRGKDKKEIFKIWMILTVVNILISILVVIFANIKLLETIIVYIMSIVYIGITIYIIRKENEEPVLKTKELFENKYDPILTRFFIKNEFNLDNTLLNSEVYYLIEKGYVEIDKEKNLLKLKNRNQFKQIDALEKINNDKIKEYSTDEIPSYESMFIGKILFAFHDEIDLNEFEKNKKENYYLQRGEICKLAMEKMILYEIEKRNMMGKANNLNFISIAGILNIITSIMLFMVIGRVNVILLLATIINIAFSGVIIKNENILAYTYSEEIIKYIDNLLEYVEVLKKEKNSQFKNLQQENPIQKSVETESLNAENLQSEDLEQKDLNEKNDDEQLVLLFGIEDLKI